MDLSEVDHLLPSAVTYSPHPLMPAKGRVHMRDTLRYGETIAEYLERSGLREQIGNRPVRVTINGWRVAREVWKTCKPKPGTLVNIQAEVRGGDSGGKDTLRIVALVALAVAAPYAAGLLLGSGASAAALGFATAGITIAGSMAINSLFPLPKPQLPSGAPSESPTYSLSGGSNRMRPYEPLPVIMGTHRMFPDAGARPYTEFRDGEQFLYQVFDFGYNDVDLSSLKIGDSPIENFTGVHLEISGADGKLTLFPGNVDSQTGAPLEWNAPIVRTSSPDATALAVDIDGLLFRSTDTGGIEPLAVGINIEYRLVGAVGWTQVQIVDDSAPTYAVMSAQAPVFLGFLGTIFQDVVLANGYSPVAQMRYNEVVAAGVPGQITIVNASRSPLRRTYKWNVAKGQYDVRVTRVTSAGDDERLVTEIAFGQLRTYQPDTADYTGRTRVALSIRASGQLQGQVDQFNAIARAKCLVWNGAAWVTQNTSNPAWWALAAARGRLVNGRRVWGAGLAESRIDLAGFQAFGAWCDAQKLTFNYVFDQPMTCMDMLSTVALRGRGTPSWGNGKISVIWDAPNQPDVAVFSMANTVAGSFSIDYSTEQLADEVVCSFTNPDTGWERDVVRVVAPGVTSPAISRTLDLVGCTNKDEAGQDANLYIAANYLRARKYRWQMDFEAMPISRGEVGVLAQDLASLDTSGRLAQGTTSTVLQIDRGVILPSTGGYVTVVKPDGTMVTKPVAGGSGVEVFQLTLTSALSFDPGADANFLPHDYKFLFGTSTVPGRRVKIEGIRPVDESTVEFTAVDETADYYASATKGYTYIPPASKFGVAAVTALTLTEDGVRAGAGYLVKVTATWNAEGDYSSADVRYSVNGGEWIYAARDSRETLVDFIVPDFSTVVFQVLAKTSLGTLGNFATASVTKTIDFAGQAVPNNITGFVLSGDGTFAWDPAPEVDVVGYKIRFHYGENRSFGDAASLHEGVLPYSPKKFDALPFGVCTFFLTAVDAAGLESATPAVIVRDLGDPAIDNIVETLDLDALFYPGTLTGGAAAGGDLLANSANGFYGDDDAQFYGMSSNVFYETETFVAMTYESTPFCFPSKWAGSRMTLDYAIEGEAYAINYRQGSPDLFYGADGTQGDAFYGVTTDPFYGAPTAWKAWPGELYNDNGMYELQVVTNASPVQGAVRNLAVVVDVPDLDENVRLAVAVGGSRVPLSLDFGVVKSVQITLDQDPTSTAVSAEVVDRDASQGPLIQLLDAVKQSVTGLADVRVRGHA